MENRSETFSSTSSVPIRKQIPRIVRPLPPIPRDAPPPVPDRSKKPQSARFHSDTVTGCSFKVVSPRVQAKSNVRLGERRKTLGGDEEVPEESKLKIVPTTRGRKKKKAKTSKRREKKRKREQFPVKICIPSGKQAVLKAKKEITVKDFAEYCINKLKVKLFFYL